MRRTHRFVTAALATALIMTGAVSPAHADDDEFDDEAVPCADVTFPLARAADRPVLRVTDPGAGDGPGTLGAAIRESNSSPLVDEIVIAAGLTVSVTDTLEIAAPAIIRGDDATVKITGANPDEPLFLTASNGSDEDYFPFEVRSLTLTGASGSGESSPAEGGIKVEAGICRLAVTDVNFTEFSSFGVQSVQGDSPVSFAISRSTFTHIGGGDTGLDGGLILDGEGVATEIHVSDSTFADNQVTAVNIPAELTTREGQRGSLTIERSVLERNHPVNDSAGAVSVSKVSKRLHERGPATDEPPIVLRDTVVRENSGEHAGGLALHSIDVDTDPADTAETAAVLLERVTFADNAATDAETDAEEARARDISVEDSSNSNAASKRQAFRIENSTFDGAPSGVPAVELGQSTIGSTISHTTIVGGGIAANLSGSAQLMLHNTAIDSGSTPGVIATEPITWLNEQHAAYTAPPAEVAAGPGRVVASDFKLAPLNGAPGYEEWMTPVRIPATDSPLLGKGAPSPDTRDQRGVARPDSGPSDIGAVQLEPDLETLTYVTLGEDAQATAGEPLRFTVEVTPPLIPAFAADPADPADEAEPDDAKPVTFKVFTVDGTATAPRDYTAIDRVFSFTPGTHTIEIPTTAGEAGTPPRTLQLVLDEPGAGVVFDDRTSATGTITYAEKQIVPPVTPPTKTDDGKLAKSGGDAPALPFLAIAAALLAVGGTLFARNRLRARHLSGSDLG